MIRYVVPTLVALAVLVLTAVLLGWPGYRGELTSAESSLPHPGSHAMHTEFRRYGLLNYLTVRENHGTAQPPGRFIDVDPRRTALTGVLVVTLWAAVGGMFLRGRRTAEPGATPARPSE